jgi:alpha-beta hydrolase superfamily lysophospholipase
MASDPSDTTLSTYTSIDGDNLAVQDWPVHGDINMRGVVLIVHGLGEHAGRYDHVARQLNDWGFAVRGYDHYGHGDSAGVRGTLPKTSRLIDDLADVVETTRGRMEPHIPLLLLGHSLGGLVAARYISLFNNARLPAKAKLPVDGLILSSPALAVDLGAFNKLLLQLASQWAPNWTFKNGLDPHSISHDPAVVQAYQNDPLVHNRISGRLARFITDTGPLVLAQAAQWKVPTLLMYAGQDRLVNAQGSRTFEQSAAKSVVTAKCFPQMYHELFNEVQRVQVFELLCTWLDSNFKSLPTSRSMLPTEFDAMRS